MKTCEDFVEEQHRKAVERKDFFATKRGSHALHPLCDDFINGHLMWWMRDVVDEEDRDEALLSISNLLAEEPDLVRDKSWDEILRLAM